jgi:hypothetical protein
MLPGDYFFLAPYKTAGMGVFCASPFGVICGELTRQCLPPPPASPPVRRSAPLGLSARLSSRDTTGSVTAENIKFYLVF